LKYFLMFWFMYDLFVVIKLKSQSVCFFKYFVVREKYS